jgi:hypothetical protein
MRLTANPGKDFQPAHAGQFYIEQYADGERLTGPILERGDGFISVSSDFELGGDTGFTKSQRHQHHVIGVILDMKDSVLVHDSD